jgi:tyrosyl-tRNA synthetase
MNEAYGVTKLGLTASHEAASLGSFENSRERVARSLEQQETSVIWDTLIEELRIRREEDLSVLSPEQQIDRLISRSKEILPAEELFAKLQHSQITGEPLKIKYGIDPTGAEVHLGHAVPMILLDRLHRMGHEVTLIIGDYTAKIGDPSGRVESRPVLTDDQIARNMASYSEQIAPLFDLSKVNVVRNSEWLNDVPMSELLAISAKIPISVLLQREDFRKRLHEGSGVMQSEFLYPIIMAMDSAHLKSDVEIGGTDQLLNMQMGRRVMGARGIDPQTIITTNLIQGVEGSGAKMSKSAGNYIALTQDPAEIFGRIMSIPDSLMESYYKMLTEIEDAEWDKIQEQMNGSLNPMFVKKLLAYDLIHVLHGKEAAETAKEGFEKKFSKRDYQTVENNGQIAFLGADTIVPTLAEARGESRSQILRLFRQGGIQIVTPGNERIRVTSPEDLLKHVNEGQLLKVGKQILRFTNGDKED